MGLAVSELAWTREKPRPIWGSYYVYRPKLTSTGTVVYIKLGDMGGGNYQPYHRVSSIGERVYRKDWADGYWLGPLPEIETKAEGTTS